MCAGVATAVSRRVASAGGHTRKPGLPHAVHAAQVARTAQSGQALIFIVALLPAVIASVFMVFNAAVESGYLALAVAGIIGTVIGAYYYLKIVKLMYFDEPAEPYAKLRQPIQGALILLAVLVVSPLGYLLIGPLGAIADRAAGSIF